MKFRSNYLLDYFIHYMSSCIFFEQVDSLFLLSATFIKVHKINSCKQKSSTRDKEPSKFKAKDIQYLLNCPKCPQTCCYKLSSPKESCVNWIVLILINFAFMPPFLRSIRLSLTPPLKANKQSPSNIFHCPEIKSTAHYNYNLE